MFLEATNIKILWYLGLLLCRSNGRFKGSFVDSYDHQAPLTMPNIPHNPSSSFFRLLAAHWLVAHSSIGEWLPWGILRNRPDLFLQFWPREWLSGCKTRKQKWRARLTLVVRSTCIIYDEKRKFMFMESHLRNIYVPVYVHECFNKCLSCFYITWERQTCFGIRVNFIYEIIFMYTIRKAFWYIMSLAI